MSAPIYKANPSSLSLFFLTGGGEMSQRILEFNWSQTAFGAIELWPPSLRMAAGICLNANFPAAIYWGKDFNLIYNDSFATVLGNQRVDALGKPGMHIWPELWPVFEPEFRKVLSGQSASLKHVALHKNGNTESAYYDFSFTPIYGEHDEPTGIFCTLAGRTQAEEALREEKEKAEQQKRFYETITSCTPDLVYVFDLEYRFTYANKALLDMWGKTWDTAIGKGLRENGYEEWHALMHEREIDHVRATKEVVRGEVAFPHATLGRRIYDYILTPVVNENGEVEAVAGTTRDITEINNAAASILESEARFRLMAEGTEVLISVGDETGAAVFFNQAWVHLTGKKTEDLMKFGWIDAMHPDDKDYVMKIFTEAFREKKPWEWEFRMPNYQGGYRWLLARGTPRFRSDNTFAGYISSSVDITEQKEQKEQLQNLVNKLKATNEEMAATNKEVETVNEELRQTQQNLYKTNKQLEEREQSLLQANNHLTRSEQTLQMALQSAGMGTWLANLVSGELQLSTKSRELHGVEQDRQLTLEAFFDWIDPAYRAPIQNAIADAIRNNTPFTTDYLLQPQNGISVRWLRVSGVIEKDESGKPLSILGTVLDITEQKQNEQRKNDFISMVSHELKTPLTSAFSYVQVSQKKASTSGDTVAAGMLERAGKQLGKMSKMINGFLNVSRLESGKIHIDQERFDLALLVKEAEEESLASVTTHQVVFAPVDETWIMADREKIGHVIENFISNAVKYSPAGSTIKVACVTINGQAQMSVQDEGMGIKEEDLPKLFERFYRVKGNETQHIAGFGIGLYLCCEIVKGHGGNIWAESTLGKGSTFYFTLPVLAANLQDN
ncbi:PAS domain S-box protein [Mucilaginibacter lacusdianchii]|uniref:PAS domain S-box protein n=1 Tax=Mucilaginibacter lacusdianchii TaxID=2684211 RepID=UPI00131B72B7|nr:PAS domain S-box protein [Mucilaginibacter sp. JXJ CY 39]